MNDAVMTILRVVPKAALARSATCGYPRGQPLGALAHSAHGCPMLEEHMGIVIRSEQVTHES
jgi:hypothetical protein